MAKRLLGAGAMLMPSTVARASQALADLLRRGRVVGRTCPAVGDDIWLPLRDVIASARSAFPADAL
jgi:hypothetical protein